MGILYVQETTKKRHQKGNDKGLIIINNQPVLVWMPGCDLVRVNLVI